MPLFEIKSRLDAHVIFSLETTSLKLCLEAAVSKKVNLSYSNLRDSDLSDSDLSDSDLSGSDLSGSDLRDSDLSGSDLRDSDLSDSNLSDSDLSGSNLRGSYLSGSNLSDSDLRGSDLSGSDLSDSDLSGSDLSGSNLRGSNLSGSNLRGSNLSDSDLSDSDLSGSDLSGSNLRGSDLSGSNLTPIRDDLWAVLSASPREVPALRHALIDGTVDGSSYEGACACLVGTLANARHCAHNAIPSLAPNSNRPAERLFLSINKGDTPSTNQFSKLALSWIDEWLVNMQSAFGPAEVVAGGK
jgi:uncharacterized protein YjbI with pentapeptide repeats